MLIIVIIIICMHLSPIARSGRELSKLNKISGRWLIKLQNQEYDFSKEIEDIQNIDWKFHKEKADLFIKIYTECSELQKK